MARLLPGLDAALERLRVREPALSVLGCLTGSRRFGRSSAVVVQRGHAAAELVTGLRGGETQRVEQRETEPDTAGSRSRRWSNSPAGCWTSGSSWRGKLSGVDDARAIEDILRVGTSAGGARAKAVLSWNEATGEFRSGQLRVEEGFFPWVMKFDGAESPGDHENGRPCGYGHIEYAYSLMAAAAGVEMTECRLHREGGRAHFMTRRFDRTARGDKLHIQSLCAMRHFDFNRPDAYSYEQAFQTMRRLEMPMRDAEQQYRRAVFNVVARNHDDHVKNIAYVMDRRGEWSLSPAFDVAYAYNPTGDWTTRHQMSIGGKRDGFVRDDLVELGLAAGLKRARASAVIDEIEAAVGRWPSFAERAGVDGRVARRIGRAHRRFGAE